MRRWQPIKQLTVAAVLLHSTQYSPLLYGMYSFPSKSIWARLTTSHYSKVRKYTYLYFSLSFLEGKEGKQSMQERRRKHGGEDTRIYSYS